MKWTRTDWLMLSAVPLGIWLGWYVLGPTMARTMDRAAIKTPLTRTLDTLPTGTIVVCYTPTHGDGVACVLDPAMQGAAP